MNEFTPPSRQRMAVIEAVRQSGGGGFDADAWHVMNERDNRLIEDELLSGAGSSKFVYEFAMGGGQTVTGISVVGARQLAQEYGGIKHRIVATAQKIGSLFTFTSYPGDNYPMDVRVQVIPELQHEGDYYQAVIEVSDLKKGVSLMVEKREARMETNRSGVEYERQHYQLIAQSKAFRNGVLALIPQDFQLRWKLKMLALGKDNIISASLIDEKRSAISRYATSKGLGLERRAIEALTLDEISGLSDAAREGLEVFTRAVDAVGLRMTKAEGEPARVEGPQQQQQPPSKATRQQPNKPPPVDRDRMNAELDAATKAAADQAKAAAAASAEQARQAKAKAELEQTEQQTKATDGPGWVGYLVDKFGDMVGDAFTDPTSWARALGKLWQDAAEADRLALLEANDEWVGEVEQMGGTAASVLRDLQNLTPGYRQAEPGIDATPSAPAFTAVPFETKRGGHLVYGKALRESLSKVGAGQLEAWAAANIETIRSTPDSVRIKTLALVSDHANAVGGALPASIAALAEAEPRPSAQAAADADSAWVEQQIADIASLPNLAAIDETIRSGAMQARMTRYRRERPDLFERLDGALKARSDELRLAVSDFPGDRP